MASAKFANNAAVFLTVAVAAADTSIALPAGSGSRFPALSGGDWFLLTLENLQTSQREIVKVTALATDTLTVVRAQEGTTAQTFPATNTVAANRVTAAQLEGFAGGGGGGATTVGGLTDGPGAPAAGNALQAVRSNAGGTALEYVDRPFEGSVTVGAAPIASEVLIRHKMTGPVRFAAGLVGWKFSGATNATANTVFTAKKGGVAFGTITVLAGTTTPNLVAASLTDFVTDEVFTLEAPATPDATLANFGITVYGTRR